MTPTPPGFERWIADAEARHLRDMTPTEVGRALRALSSTYVERRARLAGRGAFDTAGKRAAYALYYAPRRYQTLTHILGALGAATGPLGIVDVGCGTGAAGAAWAVHAGAGATLSACDSHPWAVEETRATLQAFGLKGDVRRGAIGGGRGLRPWADNNSGAQARAVMLSYMVNELGDDDRADLLPALLAAASRGARVLLVEPLSRKTSPWWSRWADAVVAAGGRADEWRVTLDLAPITARLGHAARLDAAGATARTLYL
ncbi:MAG: methyltransferase [Acidobacteria bacterium]|nr:methyltransferase [Acidobacteriota bacterium]